MEQFLLVPVPIIINPMLYPFELRAHSYECNTIKSS